MIFTENSYLVKFHVRKVLDGTIKKEDVPKFYNLQGEVYKLLDI
jgi:hypothetical protein